MIRKRNAFDQTHHELLQIVWKSQKYSILMSAYSTMITYAAGLWINALIGGVFFAIHFFNCPNTLAYGILENFGSTNRSSQKFVENVWSLSNLIRIVLQLLEIRYVLMACTHTFVLLAYFGHVVMFFKNVNGILFHLANLQLILQ